MDWRKQWADKLVSPAEAAAKVQSGERLWIGMVSSGAQTFSRELFDRASQLKGVDIYHYFSTFPWVRDGSQEAFNLHTAFTTPVDRSAVGAGAAEYIPMGNFNQSHFIAHHPPFDIGVVRMSPPDENGYLSFGDALWANRTAAMVSDRWFAEVDERLIRTYGENYLHISDVDLLFEHDTADDLELPIPARSEEVEDAANVICALVASELVNDGDCLQTGVGDVSSALVIYLENKHDIGIQTEVIPGGVMEMMERGVITGAKKQVAPGKVVGSAFVQAPAEEIAKAHMHPQLELWDFCTTDDLRILTQNRNFKAINNALQIDVTGQVTAETFGTQIFSGPGGQTVFAVAASYSDGGASIIVLPSSSLVDGVRKSRIVTMLPLGSAVTVPRTFVDYVVTERGIAKLTHKTLRERIDELTSVAHPDFRVELRKEAERAFGF